MRENKLSLLHKMVQIALIMAFITCLLAYAYIGTFMRLSGDDYCYAAFLNQGSFWEAQWNSYLKVTTYNGNRFSLTLFSGLAGIFPPVVNGILPGLVILVWLTGITFAVKKVFQILKLQVPFLTYLLIATLIEFITFFQAPDISQSLYWRSGMLPYTLPVVGGTYLFGMLLSAWSKDSPTWISAFVIFLLAFISGGFSEVGALFQIAWLGLIWLVYLARDENPGKRSLRASSIFFVAMSATILALCLLALSPTNQMRIGAKPATPGLLQMLDIVITFTIMFILQTFQGQPVPTLFSIVVPAILGFAVLFPGGVRLKLFTFSKRNLIWTAVFLFTWFGLIAVTSVPFAYIQSAEPEFRAQIISRFVMTLNLIAIGVWIGLQAGAVVEKLKIPPLWIAQYSALLVLIIASFYPVRAAWQVYRSAPRYQKWASFWDNRDRDIHLARSQGILDIHVIEMDHIIDRVGDLSQDPGAWYNACAAMYYRVNSISADLPGWDQ